MFRVGIDNYGLYPLNLNPMETMLWALDHGAEGVAFSGLDELTRSRFDCKEVIRIQTFAREHDLFIEWGNAQHVPRDLTTWEKKDLFSHNRKAAEEAQALGTRIVRSCSGGLMRWKPDSIPTRQLLEEMTEALHAQKQMLMDHNVILAIETHFEFTTYELLRLFEALDARPGEWIGICLDTMNLLTMLEDPVMATGRILPWIVSTHIKDGGFRISDSGFNSFTAPFGEGIVDFDKIFSLLETLPWDINLNIEDHGGDFDIPINNPDFRKKFPDLNNGEMEKLILLTEQTRKKMEAGALAVLNRSEWPAVCERRMANDLVRLKEETERLRDQETRDQETRDQETRDQETRD